MPLWLPGCTTPPTSACPALKVKVGSTVAGHRALVLDMPPFPVGGAHGGHVLVVWNQGTASYVVSVHFTGSDTTHTPVMRTAALAAANLVAVQ